MKKRHHRRLIIAAGAVIVAAGLAWALGALPGRPAGASGRSIPSILLGRVPPEQRLIRYYAVDFPVPIAHVPPPVHPYMASHGGNNMHNDASMTDTYEAPGPLGIEPQVRSRTQGFGGYGTIAIDRAGRLVAVQSNGRGFQLELMDPFTLAELASYTLPARPWSFVLQGVLPWEYIGAGTYFYLDNEDRAVVPSTDNVVRVVQTPASGSDASFELVREYDLSAYVVPLPWPQRDSVAWVLPDWSGECYWYATTAGMVGTIEVDSGVVRTLRLEGEIIENSFAVGQDGVFIISDWALYRLGRAADGAIVVDWRTPYDRGTAAKPGMITRGSGTSVTLLGGPEGLVAVTDNAEPRIQLLAVRRSDGSVACQTPLFSEGKSATDITVIGVEGADVHGVSTGVYTAIAENGWGHHRFPRARAEAGVVRVDFVRQVDGAYTCGEVWSSNEKNIGVFKLSLGSGLLYLYYRDDSPLVPRWYFTAVDFATGETVYRALAGTGIGYNNWAGALFLHPDGANAYSTTIFGLVMLRDAGP